MTSNAFSITEENLPDSPELASRLEELAEQAERVDGMAPLSEQFLNGLTDSRLQHRHLVAWVDKKPCGVAGLDGSTAELFIAPDFRGQGYGALLCDAAAETPNLQAWAHGNLPAAQALAHSRGLQVTRKLVVMGIGGEELAAVARPEDVPLTALNYSESVAKWGQEFVEEQWLKANNEAFSWHPEQGGWDIDRLHRGMEADWFDPADLLFLWDTAGDPVLAGFHWTKWHAEEAPGFGEVYVVGLAADYRGKKLGGPLLQIGLRRMVEKGAQRVILYVEADNDPALKAYERLGFKVDEEHVVWGVCD
ncbi:mycothiol synthase [Corynebacterium kefirresidentii]|uniref:mycothiol synthase n=1 Tax=Corynebacterium TaxID=1716 RepID=UPI0020052C5A|nr:MULTISPECIES: mycothiol synthase [Corynebacterium]MCK6083876.1 mycothiol synthase [Corynebacterium kefirresidentii]MDU7566319.1 mycothiol synthase [Corynebacterium sp.]